MEIILQLLLSRWSCSPLCALHVGVGGLDEEQEPIWSHDFFPFQFFSSDYMLKAKARPIAFIQMTIAHAMSMLILIDQCSFIGNLSF